MIDLTYTPFFSEDTRIKLSNPDLYIPKFNPFKTKVVEDDSETVQSDIEEIKETQQQKKKEKINTTPTFTGTGFNQFSQAYAASGVDRSKFNFFAKLAKKESGFDSKIQNKFGAPAYGYFQFMQDDKKWNNIRTFANTDIESFRNNPILQIQAADRLANSFLSDFNQKDLDRAKELGYSKSALVAGAWLGGVGGVRKLLHEGKSVNDYAWSKDKKSGADMKSRMDEFNNMFKRGGIIKMAKGGSDWVSEWYKGRSKIADSNLDSVTTSPFVKGAGIKKLLKNLSIAREIIDPSKVTPGSLGTYYPSSHKIYLKEEDPSTSVHEWTHASNPWVQKQIINEIKDSMGDAIFDQSHIQNDEYLDSTSEIYARLMQLRHHLGVDPDHIFTEDEIEKLKQDSIKSKTLMNRYNDGVSETKFDNKNNIIKTDGVKIGERPKDSKVFYEYNGEGVFDILNRYSTKFITRLLNEVASTKTLPKDVAYAQNGMQFVPPMLRRNSENYNYQLGTYDADSEHWSSRDPKSGLILKSENHPTLHMSYDADQKEGYKWRRGFDGRLYSDAPWEVRLGTPFKLVDKTSKVDVLKNFKGVKDVYNHILKLGASPEEAAGWTGVFIQESGLDHSKVSPKGAKGIAQLLGDELQRYNQYLYKRELPDTWKNQINYIWDQIQNNEHVWNKDYFRLLNLGNKRTAEQEQLFQQMDNSKWGEYSYENYRELTPYHLDPQHIAEVFTWTFERPGEGEALIDQRKKYAQAVYDRFNEY